MNMHADGEQITAIDTRERILLTGATGFLGGSVAAQLIAAGHGANLSFLGRAESRQQGLERLRGNLLMHGVDEADCLALRAEQILCGDFLDTSWLARETPRLMQVERVINCAAVASFSKNPTIWPVNVDGTFAFADVLSRSKRLKRFLHVGTAMCCGPQRVADQRVLGIPGGGAATGGLHRVQGGNRAAHARGTAGPAPGGGAAIHRGGPPYPWLPGLRQHLLGLPHGLRPGKLHLRPGRADRRDSGRLLRRGADRPGAEAVPGAQPLSYLRRPSRGLHLRRDRRGLRPRQRGGAGRRALPQGGGGRPQGTGEELRVAHRPGQSASGPARVALVQRLCRPQLPVRQQPSA